MWTVQNINATKEPNSAHFNLSIEYTDGTDTVTLQTRVGSKEEAKKTVRDNLTRLNEREETIDEITTATFDYQPPAPVEPTQDELDRAEWFNRYNQLKQAQPLIELGIIESTDTRLTNLQTWLATNFKAEYLNGL